MSSEIPPFNPAMNTWRVILTDSESASGVAPTCPEDHPSFEVLDCCPGPHIECWTERAASAVAAALTGASAEMCE